MRRNQVLLGSGLHCLLVLSLRAEDPPSPCQGGEPYEFAVQASTDGAQTWSDDTVHVQGPPGEVITVPVRTLMTIAKETPGWSFGLHSDDNGTIDITDAVRILNVLFLGIGTIPEPGFEECGIDPTPDPDLSCAATSDLCA